MQAPSLTLLDTVDPSRPGSHSASRRRVSFLRLSSLDNSTKSDCFLPCICRYRKEPGPCVSVDPNHPQAIQFAVSHQALGLYSSRLAALDQRARTASQIDSHSYGLNMNVSANLVSLVLGTGAGMKVLIFDHLPHLIVRVR